MSKLLGLFLMAVAVLMLINVVNRHWLFLLALAFALAYGSASGSIGQWGHRVAIFMILLIIPILFIKTMAGILFYVLPPLLGLFGIFLLLKSVAK